VATTKSAKNPTSGNDSPNTPGVSESAIAAMKVDELRRKLQNRGVKGTADLNKPELVQKLIKLETTGKKSTRSTAKKPTTSRKNPTSGNDTPKKSTRPTAKKSTSPTRTRSAKKSAPAATDRSTAKKLASAAGELPTTNELLFAQTDLLSSNDVPATVEVGESQEGGPRGTSGGGKRTGKATPDPLTYSQEINPTDDPPERPKRSRITTDHKVIRRWAKARNAVPATVAGTSRDGDLGVLHFAFPDHSGDRLTQVSWSEWFDAFDKRRLTFVYQKKLSSGERSTYFHLENPNE
jgi:hypothetical protein